MRALSRALVVAVLVCIGGCSSTSKHTASPPSTSTSPSSAGKTPAEAQAEGSANPSKTTTTLPPSPPATPDPCKLFAAADITALVGEPVKTGQDSGTGQSCNFPAVNTNGITVLLSVRGDDNPTKFADSRTESGQSGGTVSDVSLVGDQAFLYAPAGTTLRSAESRKGTVRVRVVVQGQNATSDTAIKVLTAATAKV